MNKFNDLSDAEICFEFGLLEGLSVAHNAEHAILFPPRPDGSDTLYNPMEDADLNCKARDDYQVTICYDRSLAIIYKYEPEYKIFTSSFRMFLDSTGNEIKRAVIECILKSEGKAL